MADQNNEVIEEKLKEKILQKENKKSFSSEKCQKIEEQVKLSLKKQDTDEALKDVTIGALVLGSSDIHFDCYETYVVIRFRIDGVLVDIFQLEHREYKMVLERMKYASNLKLNISNIPQDGKYSMAIDDRKIDVRTSTLPIAYGENIVSRILDNSKSVVDFEKLGFFWTSKRLIDKAISRNNGMLLVTGPTGSGKTTTLYTMLSKLNSRE
ncbi:MAG: Flp pilus assembly complex ATPase component, partial [Candidatus Gracilibacteria bacterium]|nr:Flp pilus assembly complex ATPase component [Candidatus Gracilibacteria bacterium]